MERVWSPLCCHGNVTVDNLVPLPKAYVLKPEQIKEVEWLSAGHDVLSNLPTSFGKSSIYQVFCLAKLYKVDSTCNSMVEEQVRK